MMRHAMRTVWRSWQLSPPVADVEMSSAAEMMNVWLHRPAQSASGRCCNEFKLQDDACRYVVL